jgi:hypothetical protein
MKSKCLLVLLAMAHGLPSISQNMPSAAPRLVLRVWVQGDTSRLPDFVESCKREFAEKNIDLQVARPDDLFDYNVIVVQGSSISGAAGAVVVLNHKGQFVASVVRSGRWSGKGALNASAKELAKKMTILAGGPPH